jgi:hypothetical protein
MKRKPIPKNIRDLALMELKACLEARIREKGDGAFVSIHEMRGVLSEEWQEVKEAMHLKQQGLIEAELMDLAVGAIFAYACLRSPCSSPLTAWPSTPWPRR